jgi:LmbE family N-acetylglucosaminyl deacetylase
VTAVAQLGTILGVWAHPDDEAYLMGGIAALAADAGQLVACVTATYGEAGQTADAARWPQSRLADIRRAELAESLAILGIGDHQWLGHPDGRLDEVDARAGIAQVEEAITRVQPNTVVTFGSDGMTGHPDHRTIGAWAEAAFRSSAPPGSRLLAATKELEWAGRFPDINPDVFPDGAPHAPPGALQVVVTLEDDVLDRKVRALEAQASQTAALVAAIGRRRFAEWVQHEFWVEVARS